MPGISTPPARSSSGLSTGVGRSGSTPAWTRLGGSLSFTIAPAATLVVYGKSLREPILAPPRYPGGPSGLSGIARLRSPLYLSSSIAAWEEPEIFASEIRAAFRSLR